jgi:predicted metal-dependent phosphoesterase TrpH
MQYRLNIHAHTIFSDGCNSVYTMALKAKEIGLSALVITDHFYGLEYPEFMTLEKYKILKKEAREAAEILPVIVGLEVVFMGQEVLVFGESAILQILTNGKPDMNTMLRLKTNTGCAIILCHPGEFEFTVPALDGFEHFNSGHNYFPEGKRDFGSLAKLPRWCNSDSHIKQDLETAYNIIDTEIKTELDLIKYIKSGKQPEFYIKGK